MSAQVTFAEDTVLFNPQTGYNLDDSYYSADEQSTSATTRGASSPVFSESFKLKVLSKGAFTYSMKAEWKDAQGNNYQFSRNSVFAWVPLVFTIPKGARDVFLTTIVDDGFYGKPVIGVSLTPPLVAENKPHYTEFHMWGTTLFPRWSRID